MTHRRRSLARAFARPLAAAAMLAYLLLPLLYAAHVSIAHGGDLSESVARHFLPRPTVPSSQSEHPQNGGHCDLCRLLASVATGGARPAPAAALALAVPDAVGRVITPPVGVVLRHVVPVALQPRAPPFC